MDTYVNSGSPDQVGSGLVDRVGVDPTLGVTRSLYFFPHANLPDGAQIVNATFGVYLAGGTASGQVVRASGIAASWNGNSATWNNQPSTDATSRVDTPIGNLSGGWLNIDVSNIIRAPATRATLSTGSPTSALSFRPSTGRTPARRALAAP